MSPVQFATIQTEMKTTGNLNRLLRIRWRVAGVITDATRTDILSSLHTTYDCRGEGKW